MSEHKSASALRKCACCGTPVHDEDEFCFLCTRSRRELLDEVEQRIRDTVHEALLTEGARWRDELHRVMEEMRRGDV